MNISSIPKGIGKGLSKVAETKFIKRTLEYGYKNPDKFLVAMVVTSIASKDLVNGYYYTKQSLNNKRIPEENRSFVASLDAMNCGIMVGGQVLASLVIEKTVTEKLFNKIIGKKLDHDILGNKARKLVEADKSLNYEVIKEGLIKKCGSESKPFKAMKGGFTLLMTFLATAALMKRVVAPLIATPLAGWFKNKYMDKNIAKNKAKQENKIVSKQGDMIDHTSAPWNHSNKAGK